MRDPASPAAIGRPAMASTSRNVPIGVMGRTGPMRDQGSDGVPGNGSSADPFAGIPNAHDEWNERF